jgi:hypothetical protein
MKATSLRTVEILVYSSLFSPPPVIQGRVREGASREMLQDFNRATSLKIERLDVCRRSRRPYRMNDALATKCIG